LPVNAGLTAWEMIEAAENGKVKAMFIMGENPAVSFPQTSLVKEALAKLDFLVVTDMFMTETAGLASVVLPAASFAEKSGTFTNFEGRVQQLTKAIGPFGQSRPDAEIIMELSGMMNHPLKYNSQQEVLNEIEEEVPFCHHFTRIDSDAIEPELAEEEDGYYGNRRLHKGLFPSGFGRFLSVGYTAPQEAESDGYTHTLIVGSSRYHFGTGARSTRSGRLFRFAPEAFLEISDDDAADMGIVDGDKVKVISAEGEIKAAAKVNNALSRGLLYMPMSYPNNPVYSLFPAVLDRQVKTPALKSCAVRLERTDDNG
jgi:predicted molibdopterin-dependent oxidoreductase YjgC